MVKTTTKTKKPTTRKPAASERESTAAPRKHSESFRPARKPKVVPTEKATKPARRSSRPPAIVLDPDVRLYFPDSDAVNRALRQLIRLIPRRREPKPE